MVRKFIYVLILMGLFIYGRFLYMQEIKVEVIIRGKELSENLEKELEKLAGEEFSFRYHVCENRACEYLDEEFTAENYYKAQMIAREMRRIAAKEVINLDTRIALPKFK